MVFHNFDELIAKVKGAPSKKIMAVACANDDHTLEAVVNARREGIIEPILVGDKKIITEILADLKEEIPEENIIDVPAEDLQQACEKAVKLVSSGKADFLMKGKVDTKIILKEVVNKEYGLGQGRLMSHFTMFEVPTYHKVILPVDGGMVTYPDLMQKKDIIQNTVDTLCAMGYDCPKVGVLACVEKVNPKMPESVDAAELQAMNERGEITNCIVEGPIQYDCVMRKDLAEFKGLKSKIAGDPDVLVAPNIHAGNIMGKMYAISCGAKMAGFIVGAKCPIVMVSRSSTAEEKYLSIVVSAAAVK
ncbi:phosphate acyltransferase [Pseudobutyrivibrio sp.]|uniref:phosphate acyltransferase n=1 Tax=Pseudobutyrivibrio sp. TaxID=2014367 RepID=UPI001D48F904|nr:phosphate acyltransferase [Pseudobutyrivibrio sp.]MBE5911707.1 phosphate butyryltransferase [Pseudobutyrivibrio sp.]